MDNKVVEELVRLAHLGDIHPEAAVATIITTSGSTPRKEGSQMIISRSGQIIGTIGGGSGEEIVRHEALKVIEQGHPLIVKINMTQKEALVEGMICGGIMQVYIEPVLYKPLELC